MGRGKPAASSAVMPPLVAAQNQQAVLAWLRRQPALRVDSRRRSQGVLASGIVALDALLGGGVPAGAISELVGRRGAGRASLALAILAATTRRGGVVAWVDAGDSLDPLSVAAAGVVLERFLWVRLAAGGAGEGLEGKRGQYPLPGSHPAEGQEGRFGARGGHVLHRQGGAYEPTEQRRPRGRGGLHRAVEATDLLLEAGGFAAVVLDVASLRSRAARPATWIRLARRLEHGSTALLLLASRAVSGCASLRLGCRRVGALMLQVQIDRQRGRADVGRGVRVALAPPVD